MLPYLSLYGFQICLREPLKAGWVLIGTIIECCSILNQGTTPLVANILGARQSIKLRNPQAFECYNVIMKIRLSDSKTLK